MGSDQMNSSDRGSEDHSNIDRISLNDYVSDNSNLFLVMGVFAALSVYISDIPSDNVDEQFIQLGLVTSLLITGLLGLIIILSLSNQVSDDSVLLSSLLHVKNLDTIVFLTLFATLFYSLFQVITEETEVLSVILVAILFVGSFAFLLTVIMRISSQLAPYIDNSELRTTTIATFVFTVSFRVVNQVKKHLFGEYQLHQFQFDGDVAFAEAFPAIVYANFSLMSESLAVIARVMGFIALMVLLAVAGDKYRRFKDLMTDH